MTVKADSGDRMTQHIQTPASAYQIGQGGRSCASPRRSSRRRRHHRKSDGRESDGRVLDGRVRSRWTPSTNTGVSVVLGPTAVRAQRP